MAAGDFKWFAQALHDLGNKIHDLDNDDLRLGIVTNANVPTVNETAPHWGGSGTTNFATNEVATGTAYTGPIVLTSEAWTLEATGAILDFANPTIAQDAGGFTDAAYGIVFNNTDANKRGLGFVEISSGGTGSNVGGALNVNLNAAGALRLAQS